MARFDAAALQAQVEAALAPTLERVRALVDELVELREPRCDNHDCGFCAYLRDDTEEFRP